MASRRTWLDPAEAAEWLGVEVRFVRRLVAERRVTYYKVGRHLRFDASDLDQFLDSVRVEKSSVA